MKAGCISHPASLLWSFTWEQDWNSCCLKVLLFFCLCFFYFLLQFPGNKISLYDAIEDEKNEIRKKKKEKTKPFHLFGFCINVVISLFVFSPDYLVFSCQLCVMLMIDSFFILSNMCCPSWFQGFFSVSVGERKGRGVDFTRSLSAVNLSVWVCACVSEEKIYFICGDFNSNVRSG